ncbi:nitrile hydratase subunit alpha [Paraburkholderia mimosarum]|uniref:nitrile hydratase subunit alpha n=1 Tax=Paraburkholderia mimosarum TaxID=312026 RepID=UPI0039C20292
MHYEERSPYVGLHVVSCYPWTLLGTPPVWFKSPAYRAKVVSHPREVSEDFGVTRDPGMTVHVWDTSAEQSVYRHT